MCSMKWASSDCAWILRELTFMWAASSSQVLATFRLQLPRTLVQLSKAPRLPARWHMTGYIMGPARPSTRALLHAVTATLLRA
jgi:hypothetical protein